MQSSVLFRVPRRIAGDNTGGRRQWGGSHEIDLLIINRFNQGAWSGVGRDAQLLAPEFGLLIFNTLVQLIGLVAQVQLLLAQLHDQRGQNQRRNQTYQKFDHDRFFSVNKSPKPETRCGCLRVAPVPDLISPAQRPAGQLERHTDADHIAAFEQILIQGFDRGDLAGIAELFSGDFPEAVA